MNAKRLLKRWATLHRFVESLKSEAKNDSEMLALAKQLEEVRNKISDLREERGLAEAERKDLRVGNPTLWEIFRPDEILGMLMVRRSAHRIFNRRFPTWLDFAGMVFGLDKDTDRYKETVEAEKSYSGPWEDFSANMAMLEYRKALSKKRMLENMPAWGRHLFAEAA